MNTPKTALPIRVVLLVIALIGVSYLGVVTLQVIAVIRPTAADLRGMTRDLLSDHDSIDGTLATLREARRQVARLAPPVVPSSEPLPALWTLRSEVRSALDGSAAIRASVERANVPLEMRLLLAQALEQEAAVAIRLLEALRAIELERPVDAVEALRASGIHSDSTARLLSAAQRVALADLLSGQERLVDRLSAVERWSGLWALAGAVAFLFAAWMVRTRLYVPLGELEGAVRRVTDGDLNAEVPVARDDELGRLSEHVNAMTAVLRERAAEESRRRESLTERFGRILDESANQICVFDADSLQLVQANRGTRVALGYSRDEITALRLPDLLSGMPAERIASLLEGLRQADQPPVLLSTWLRRKDGTLRPAELTIQHTRDGGVPIFITVAEDAGVRQRVRDLDERLREFTLMEQDALTGTDPLSVLRPLMVMAADALQATGCGVWRTVGDPASCIVAYDARDARHVTDAPWPAEAAHALRVPIRTGGRVAASLVVSHEGERRTWTAEERTFGAAVADLAARVLEADERRTLEQTLERAQRMDSIGQLAGGVAHDFNNILTAILGNLESCRADLTPGSPMDVALGEAEHAALRAADLTRQLLTFARHQVSETRVVDVIARARDAEPMLRRLLGTEWTLVTEYAPDVPQVRLGAGQLEQLLVNLVVNARDAMPTGGPITVSTTRELLDATAAAAHPGLAPGPHTVLTVRDEGIGMDRRTAERVFEPFFTTKRPGEGTGLGLAVCYGIVRNAGGTIHITSAPGQGTTFRLYLPAATAGRLTPIDGTRAVTIGGEGEVVLLAEDEPAIRTLMTRMLRASGYRVLTAEDGEEALGLAEGHAGPIALLITDVVMPRLGGIETARRLRQLRPGLPVLFMSGYTATAAVQEGDLEDAGFLAKPFTPEELRERVRAMLDQPAAASPDSGAR
jgi:PAS domain S-box-containing protein